MLVDSNILIYSINSDSPKHKAARKFLQANYKSLSVAHQNVIEAIRVLTHPKFSRPMTIANALASLEAITDSLKIITPNQKSYYLTLELIKEHNLSGNRIFDAYLAATALSNDVFSIATDNIKDFEKFMNIRLINPFK